MWVVVVVVVVVVVHSSIHGTFHHLDWIDGVTLGACEWNLAIVRSGAHTRCERILGRPATWWWGREWRKTANGSGGGGMKTHGKDTLRATHGRPIRVVCVSCRS